MTQKKAKKIPKQSKTKTIVVSVIILSFLALMIVSNFIGNNSNSSKNNSKKNIVNYLFQNNGELTFSNSGGNYISKINIEVADNDEERAQGLMFRTSMQEDQGMLFIFPQEAMQSFWMRNTFIPLDILFVSSDLEIVTIHRNTETTSDQSYPSSKKAKYVVEVNAGYCDKFKVNEGDKIVFRMF
ncbi:MAG: DUF192 domain-containing protein [Melioribacteraceae bacterium]|nr:DUF192 domain-containing protein [Melioribacteraceae bacterium]